MYTIRFEDETHADYARRILAHPSEEERHSDVTDIIESETRAQTSRDSMFTRYEEERKRLQDLLAQANGKVETVTRKSREQIKELLTQQFADSPKIPVESESLVDLWTRIFRTARFLGFTNEARRFADEMGLGELFEQVAERLNVDHMDTSSDNRERLVSNEVHATHPVHPLDPRLSEVWKKAWRVANELEFCDEFARIADRFGIEPPRMTWSGNVTITYRNDVTLYFEDVEADSRSEAIDALDIPELAREEGHHLDWSTSWDIEDYEAEVEFE